MPRRRDVPKRRVPPDPKYQDLQVARFTHVLMRCGKKSLAQSITYKALDLVEARTQEEALRVFKRAIDNVRPRVEVKSRRVGGATYQVPIEVRPERGLSLAMRWILAAARGRSGKPMSERLAFELIEAANERGDAVKKREDAHRMAEANKAFAHYRW